MPRTKRGFYTTKPIKRLISNPPNWERIIFERRLLAVTKELRIQDLQAKPLISKEVHDRFNAACVEVRLEIGVQ